MATRMGLENLGLEPKRESTSPVRSSFTMLAAASKVPELSAILAAASEVHEPQEQRSCRTGFKPMSHGDKTDMKHPTNETSRPLSGSRQKQSSKPKQTTSRSRPVQRHSRKSDSKIVKKNHMKDHTNIQGQNQGQLQDHYQGQPQDHQVHILGLLIKGT